MAKRSDTYETVMLALQLLQRIPRGRKVTADELRQQIESAGIQRDLRTIQRQLTSMCEHFDIDCDVRSKPYGYSWKEQAKGLSLPALTPQESLLLQLAEEYLSNLLPARLMKSMEGFFTQARRNLEFSSNTRLEREWKGKVRVVATSQPLLPPAIVPGVFEVVSEALYNNHWLKIDYRNAGGKQTSIEVMPLGLAQQGPRMYLVCRYRGYDNERSLALHRMLSAEMTPFAFDRPNDFNLKQYDDAGRFGFGEGDKIKLTFQIDQDAGFHLAETPLSSDQQVVELEDGRLEITATVVDSAMLEWWLRGFGEAVSEVRRETVGTWVTMMENDE